MLEPTGSETQVLAASATSRSPASSASASTAKPGDEIKVTPDLSVIHLFNKDGKRVN